MTPDDGTEARIEAAATAWRPRDPTGIRTHHAWHDLSEDDRVRAFDAARANRVIEAALDADGLSTTARAVLARIAASQSGE